MWVDARWQFTRGAAIDRLATNAAFTEKTAVEMQNVRGTPEGVPKARINESERNY